MFRRNLDSSGRILRGIIAFALLFAAYWYNSLLILAASAFVFLEAAYGWCVFYQMIGKNSCPIDKDSNNANRN